MAKPASPPRRSSRAKPTTTSVPSPLQNASSSSSASSSLNDRNPRSIGKKASTKSSNSQNQEEDDTTNPPQAPTAADPPQTRRSGRRGQEEPKKTKADTPLPPEPIANNVDEEEENEEEEEETTRCICGFEEYQGPPLESNLPAALRLAKTISNTDTDVDENGALFIQCDTCSVWQHGGCVGIMTEASTPENYFCETCRPEFHRLSKNTANQKYSKYLPLTNKNIKPLAGKTSFSKDALDKSTKAALESTKRRSTMNSRAAYEEDEMLRKVLEESKHDSPSIADSGVSRKGKRGREESDDQKSDPKRIKPNSNEASPSRIHPTSSEEQLDQQSDSKRKQVPRGAAAKSQREKELRDKERELQRAEAASKRKGRAERRRGEELDEAGENGTSENAASNSKGKAAGKKGRRNKNANDNSDSPAQGSGADKSRAGKNSRGSSGGRKEPSMNEMKKRANGMLQILNHVRLNIVKNGDPSLVKESHTVEDIATKLAKWQREFINK